jgi:hypothetical protein
MLHRSNRSKRRPQSDAASADRWSYRDNQSALSSHRGLRDFRQFLIRPRFASQDRAEASSEDGVIAIKLICRSGSLLLERTETRADLVTVIYVMEFREKESFERWCAADRLQLTYPLFYSNLRRNGGALFDAVS